MRKAISLFLAFTLLSVSSVPAFAEAARCVGPELAVMESEHAGHHHDDAAEVSHLGHDHATGLHGDWQKERIECGCGCHRSVESLPHLLAPHMIDSSIVQLSLSAVIVPPAMQPALVNSPVRVPVPPPQLIS